MHHFSFSVYGVRVCVATRDAAIGCAAQTLLRHFRAEQLDGPAAVEMVFHGVRSRADVPISISPSAALMVHTKRVVDGVVHVEATVHLDDGRLIADFHEAGLVVVDARQKRAEGYLVMPEAIQVDVRASYLLFALAELLAQEGLYTLHAAALAQGGRGLLIPGFSGRGKTTCCVALLRAGFTCLSDDHPLLRVNHHGLEMLPFPVKIDVTDGTVAFFPELRAAKDRLHQGVQKRYFFAEEIYPPTSPTACAPAVILFPQIVDWPTSHVEPMPKSRALEELLPHGLLAWDKEMAGIRFHLLARLVSQAACYRLHFGADVLDLPRLVEPLLAASSATTREPAVVEDSTADRVASGDWRASPRP
ncbi:MAG: hypothetical protein HY691_03195 [Chloroflexi bacterium]|nr:hypothetical protein [Chloroflexota bacterium]